MRGGAQAQLMRCDDEAYYVVKFQNNPQGARILANELLGTRLAARLGLPTPAAAVVEVRENLIAHTEDLVIQLGAGARTLRARAAIRFAVSGSPAETVVFDFLPDEQLREIVNSRIFAGCSSSTSGPATPTAARRFSSARADEPRYQALMIDQGFCFNAGEWNFPDAPLRGLYARHRVYESVRGIDSFEPWLARIEGKIDGSRAR